MNEDPNAADLGSEADADWSIDWDPWAAADLGDESGADWPFDWDPNAADLADEVDGDWSFCGGEAALYELPYGEAEYALGAVTTLLTTNEMVNRFKLRKITNRIFDDFIT